MQVISECLALYATQNDILPQIFEYIKSHSGVGSCILISAVFSHADVPGEYVRDAVSFLNDWMKNTKYAAIATHALTSVVLTHQMRLATLDICHRQFQVLYELLHSPAALQPLTLFVVGECFGAIAEAFPSELDSSFPLTLEFILRSLELSPVSYGKEVYFEVARATYLFAHHFSSLAPISYPKSVYGSTSLQLRACAALSDFLKFERIDIDTKDLLRKVLVLLQRTGDARASHFIAVLASFMQADDVSFWIATIKRILIADSLLEGNSNSIEPSPEVKQTCLEIANFIVPMIAEAPVLSTENLDDLISAVSRATETDRLSLQEAAFPPLQKVIELFSARVTDEGQRVLDLYDSQFSSAVKTGFRVNLAISNGFLSSYLTFNTDNMTVDPENCATILVRYLAGLQECAQRTTSYFALATHLCTVGRKYPPLREHIQPFLKTLTPIFSELVLQDMQLYRAASDWRDLSRFRSLASTFYRELLPAFVWLQKVSEVVIDVEVLVSFLLVQLKSRREAWIKSSAFDAVPVAVKSFGDRMSPAILDLAIRVSRDYFVENKQSVNPATWTELLSDAAALVQPRSGYDGVRELILGLVVGAPKLLHSIVAVLLRSDERRTLSKFSAGIVRRVLSEWKEQPTVPLLTILFNHTPAVIGQALEATLAQRSLPIEFQIDVVLIGLLHSKGNLPIDSISRFVIGGFKKGAMHMVGRVLVEHEDVGVALLADGAAKAAFLLSAVEKGNARAYLRFIQLCVGVLKKHGTIGIRFAECAIRLAVTTIAKYGGEKLIYGRQIVTQCIYVIKDAIDVLGERRSGALFSTLPIQERESTVEFISASIRAAEQRKKTENLVSFSRSERSNKQGEWQALDAEGGSASDSN
jgi:hypothetical protein